MTKKLVIKFRWLLLFVICATALAAKEYGVRSSSEPEGPAAQDVMRLEQRINLLEQRLYGIESNISRLQQQALSSGRSTPAPVSRDPEIDQMRNEIEILKGRLRELECGMAHIDERTLSAGAKARRRAGEQAKEPCRLNPEESIPIKVRQ